MQQNKKRENGIPIALLSAVAAAQLFFWLIYNPIFIQPETGPFEAVEISDFTLASLASPDKEALTSADFEAVHDDRLYFFDLGYYATRSRFTINNIPESGLAFWARVPGDNGRVFLNGRLLYDNGRFILPDISYDKISYKLLRIPASMLNQGDNRLEIIMVYDIAREARVTEPVMGEYRSMARAYNWQGLLRSQGRAITVAIGFTLALFALVALIRAQKRALLFWLFALSALWALQNMFHIWAQIPLHGNVRGLYYCAVTLVLSACWPIFVDEWTGKPKKYFQFAITFALVVALSVVVYLLIFWGDRLAFTQVEFILDWSGLLFIVAVVARLIWHFLSGNDQRHWEAALLITLALLVAVQRINLFFWGMGPPYFELSQPLFLIAFAIAYFSRNFRLFQSSAQINNLLQTQLGERTSELAVAHDREKRLVRSQALDEERQRIMRDMHDGLGSNLISMLMMAKRGKAKHSDYADGLQQVIDEMRLMIDSMDTVGKSLRSALSIFRKRIVPRAKQAGFNIAWNEKIERDLPYIGPRNVLQIFRILQEAVTNALKHSGGDQITIDVSAAVENGDVNIAVIDNGSGIDENKNKGRGLANMKTRAESAGAQLAIESNSKGTNVLLVIPGHAI